MLRLKDAETFHSKRACIAQKGTCLMPFPTTPRKSPDQIGDLHTTRVTNSTYSHVVAKYGTLRTAIDLLAANGPYESAVRRVNELEKQLQSLHVTTAETETRKYPPTKEEVFPVKNKTTFELTQDECSQLTNKLR
jgi:hypothetical protein